MAADQDVVLSFEGGGSDGGMRLATSGIGSAYLTVVGQDVARRRRSRGRRERALRAGHQILQMKDLSQTDKGLKLNWTVVAGGGTNRTSFPARRRAGRRARPEGLRLRRSSRRCFRRK